MYGFGMLDFGARFHAPLLGRWTSVDQLSEKYYSWSPYVFCLNNPVRNTDSDGRIVETGWDAANVAMDATSLIANAATGNYWSAAVDGAALIYDVAATAVPGLPGGAGGSIEGLSREQGCQYGTNCKDCISSYEKQLSQCLAESHR